MKENIVEQKWEKINEALYLTFTFYKRFTKQQAEEAISNWNSDKAVKLANSDKYSLIFDTLNMNDFEGSARKLWQDQLTAEKNNLDKIWLISHSAVIRTAAKTMGFLAGYNIVPVNSRDEIDF